MAIDTLSVPCPACKVKAGFPCMKIGSSRQIMPKFHDVRVKNAAASDEAPMPIPMRLNCPQCGALHVDKGDFATRRHHTHACQNCGMVWRPAVVATVGVQFLPGFKDD